MQGITMKGGRLRVPNKTKQPSNASSRFLYVFVACAFAAFSYQMVLHSDTLRTLTQQKAIDDRPVVSKRINVVIKNNAADNNIALEKNIVIDNNGKVDSINILDNIDNTAFDYDRKKWDKQSPRVILLVGPHKTASTTLQYFFCRFFCMEVPFESEEEEFPEAAYPQYTEWIWPIDHFQLDKSSEWFQGEYEKRYRRLTLHLAKQEVRGLAASVAEDLLPAFYEHYKAMFRRIWEKGKKIMIACEELDLVILDLLDNTIKDGNGGEETHVAPGSSDLIDAHLDLLPWNSTTGTSQEQVIDPLQLHDFEVVVNYRNPRIDHLRSMWRQFAKNNDSFQAHLQRAKKQLSLDYWESLNSLAVALQFVRKGLKTTIVDMAGVKERDTFKMNETNGGTLVGGLPGVIACEVIKMGQKDPTGTGGGVYCDDNSYVFLPNITIDNIDENKKSDKNSLEVNESQLEDMNRAIQDYDCGVWKHLKKYQEKGLLRVLYPSKDSFLKSCTPDSRDISYRDLLLGLATIASRPE